MTEPEQPQSDESERQSFIVEKLGGLYAASAKVAATLDRLTTTDASHVSGGNRRLLHIVIALLIVLIVLLAAHAAYSAGWFGG